MDWFTSFVKVAGASFPVTSSLVQFLSEIEACEIQGRIRRLEDPISGLHPDINRLSEILYNSIKVTDDLHFELEDDIYEKYSRVLACLQSEGLIKGHHSLGGRFTGGLSIADPSYIIYMCVLFEDAKKMEVLYQQVDGCSVGTSLNGKDIKKSIGLPLPVIRAAFQIFEAKGYGICSREMGSVFYIGNA